MQRDYYALRRAELTNILKELNDQAAIVFDKAIDKHTREYAENLMERAALEAVKNDPHLAYLWFWARKEEAEKEESKRSSEIANIIRGGWQKELRTTQIPDDLRLPDISVIKQMPTFSFMLSIRFKLQKPYISRDERDFYLLDNPLRKEKIFQIPMVSATSWKGALRAALWQLGYEKESKITVRLLGNPRDGDEHQAGRLYFYPTFFDKIGLEVINPHSRKTGVGERGPILMECVPEGVGTLLLLYVPFGPFEQKENERCAEVAQDLEVLAEGVQAMLTTYGFGAKTSSGFGTAQDQLAGEGKLALRADLPDEATLYPTLPETEQPVHAPARYLISPTQLHPDLCRSDGSIKLEAEYQALLENRGKKYTKADSQLYAKAKSWWEREGQHLTEASTQKPEPEAEAESNSIETPPVSIRSFTSLSEMRKTTQRMAEQLREVSEA